MSRFYFVRWIKAASRHLATCANKNFAQLIYAALVLNLTALCSERMSSDSSFNTLFRVSYTNICSFVCLCLCMFVYVMFVWVKSMNANVFIQRCDIDVLIAFFPINITTMCHHLFHFSSLLFLTHSQNNKFIQTFVPFIYGIYTIAIKYIYIYDE